VIFAFVEDGRIVVHQDDGDARRWWEPLDVESGAVVFYDDHGRWLKPEFTAAGYRLVPQIVTPPEVDPINVALAEAAGVDPNPHFESVAAIRDALKQKGAP
jgi:hypothetical protein